MDAVLRGAAVYLILLVIMRLAGRRTVGETTTFDFVLLLIIAETTQQALLGEDFSITNAFLLVTTLVGMNVLLSYMKRQSDRVDRVMDGLPIVIVENGQPIEDRMHKARLDNGDILAAARKLQGLERMEQIKYAVLEADGGISIIPREGASQPETKRA